MVDYALMLTTMMRHAMGLPTYPVKDHYPSDEERAKMSSPPPPPIDDLDAPPSRPAPPPLEPDDPCLTHNHKAEAPPPQGLLRRVLGRFTAQLDAEAHDPQRGSGAER